MMNLDEMLRLDGEIITEEQFDEITESEECINFENNGLSGQYNNCVWYSIRLKQEISDFEETEIQVYLER